MLSSVMGLSTSRFREVRAFLNLILSHESEVLSKRQDPELLKIEKGLFFVHLYGSYEFTVNELITRALAHIDSVRIVPQHCKSAFLSIVLHPEFQSLVDGGRGNKWPKRLALLAEGSSSVPKGIISSAFYYDLMNVDCASLEVLWQALCMTEPLFPDLKLRGRINELIENRNKVSHGRESPSEVGALYSAADLQGRFDDLHEFCTRIVGQVQQHVQAAGYLQVQPAAAPLE